MAAGITYQYLSAIEHGKENFSIQVIERIAEALKFPLKTLVSHAYANEHDLESPKVTRSFFRPSVPLPEGLTIDHIEEAMNQTQALFHLMNRNMTQEVNRPLRDFIQGNNFSGLVSNIFTDALDAHSPYKHNHEQKHPDLVNLSSKSDSPIGLEVKATINIGKGGESHNGHNGWHTIVCYIITEFGIAFVHVMFAELKGHTAKNPDWQYIGSKENAETGSRRTETYTTNLQGTTKLRDGSVYLDPSKVNFSRWRQKREASEPTPPWSIFFPG